MYMNIYIKPIKLFKEKHMDSYFYLLMVIQIIRTTQVLYKIYKTKTVSIDKKFKI